MSAVPRQWLICFAILFFLTTTWLPCSVTASTPQTRPGKVEDFPSYPVIKPNIQFWIDIFTRYEKSQGVIHDARDLSKIFGVIALDPAETRAAAKKNRKIKKEAIEEIKAILLNLAKGRPAATKKEKQVAALFGPDPDSRELTRAAQSLRIQTGLRQHFKEGIIRSGAYLPEFKKIFKSYGLPEDLVYLPCVESSFNVKAYSKFGAAGIWQFTRSTGKLYMEIGYVVDQRRDPFVATHGAAKLLKRNFGELASWPLAITAYNHGLNGMRRAKRQHQDYPQIYRDYQSRSFKFASRNFYAEFLAARQVAKHYQDYFGDLRLDKPISHTRFTTRGYVPADELSQALNLPPDTLARLNPALRPPVFDGRKYIPKNYELRLPPTISRDALEAALAGMYREKQRPSRFHLVQKGDTAGSIARTHGVSLNELILANNLSRRATIYIGQTLRIPVRGEAAVLQASAAAPLKQKRPKKEKAAPHAQAKQAATADVSPQPPKAPTPPKEPTVPPPPTVPAVPAVPETPEAAEASAEALPEQTGEATAKAVRPGQISSLTIVTADLKIQKHLMEKGRAVGLIHVAPEETLGHYADWLKIPTQKIRALNRLTYGRPITIGQTVKIPLPDKESQTFEEQRYEFHQEILEDFFDSFFVAGTDTYEIKSGDTLWNLCVNTLEIPLWLLEKYNPGIDLNRLKLGQQLTYPLVSPNHLEEGSPDRAARPHLPGA